MLAFTSLLLHVCWKYKVGSHGVSKTGVSGVEITIDTNRLPAAWPTRYDLPDTLLVR